jgi:hypothetical protein
MNARSRAGIALAFVCLLSTPSCVTAALWEDHRTCRYGHGWSEAAVVGRVVLTPFTLLLDGLIISAYACASCGHCCR